MPHQTVKNNIFLCFWHMSHASICAQNVVWIWKSSKDQWLFFWDHCFPLPAAEVRSTLPPQFKISFPVSSSSPSTATSLLLLTETISISSFFIVFFVEDVVPPFNFICVNRTCFQCCKATFLASTACFACSTNDSPHIKLNENESTMNKTKS